jgi:hypothetical protein
MELENQKTRSIQVKLTDQQLQKFTERAVKEGFSSRTECLRYLMIKFAEQK